MNRSQEKAFAIFNKEIRSKQMERERSVEFSNQSNNLLIDKKEPSIKATNDKVSEFLNKKNSH